MLANVAALEIDGPSWTASVGLSSVYVVADEDSETVVGAALKAVETYINLTDWSVTDSWTDDAGRLWLEFGYDPSL